MAGKIEVKLYTYDHLSMRNKRFTHMTSEVTWFGSHVGFNQKHKNLLQQNSLSDRSRGNFTSMFHKACMYKVRKESLVSHGLAAILDLRKYFKMFSLEPLNQLM